MILLLPYHISKKESETLVSGEELSILGFGKFEVITQSARTCRNPQTGEQMQVPEKKVVKFRGVKSLAKKVAK